MGGSGRGLGFRRGSKRECERVGVKSGEVELHQAKAHFEMNFEIFITIQTTNYSYFLRSIFDLLVKLSLSEH